jgi:integral membrane protein
LFPGLFRHGQTAHTYDKIMIQLLKTKVGRLRITGFLEGVSLLALVFIAVPVKYIGENDSLVKALGPVHGAIFLLFLFITLSVGVEQNWKFKTTTWKVILACFIPFGTFYIDKKILSKIN